MSLQIYKIASVEVGSAGAATIDFTSIPQGYRDLVLHLSLRTNYASTWSAGWLRFNSTTSGYSDRSVESTGAGINSFANQAGGAYIYIGTNQGTGSTSNTFGNKTIYIPNYTGSSAKSISVDNVTENNGTTAYSELTAGLSGLTSAITSISITDQAGSFVQYSKATLYGIL